MGLKMRVGVAVAGVLVMTGAGVSSAQAGAGADPGPGQVSAQDKGTALAPAQPYGRVVSPSGINLRELPTTDSPSRGTLGHGAEVGLTCKVHGQNVDGNDLWYRLRDRAVWAAARYVQNVGAVPFCPKRPAVPEDGPAAPGKDREPSGPLG